MKEVCGNHFNFKYDPQDEVISQTIIKIAENTYDQVTEEYGIEADEQPFEFIICPNVASFIKNTGKSEDTYQSWMVGNADYERPDAIKLSDEDYFFENDGYNYSGAYMGYFVRKYGMEAFKEVYAEKKPLEDYIYDGFEEDAIDSFLISNSK